MKWKGTCACCGQQRCCGLWDWRRVLVETPIELGLTLLVVAAAVGVDWLLLKGILRIAGVDRLWGL